MQIKDGGQLEKVGDEKKVKEITVIRHENSRMGELWINNESVSYLSIDELIDLKKEIHDTLEDIIKSL